MPSSSELVSASITASPRSHDTGLRGRLKQACRCRASSLDDSLSDLRLAPHLQFFTQAPTPRPFLIAVNQLDLTDFHLLSSAAVRPRSHRLVQIEIKAVTLAGAVPYVEVGSTTTIHRVKVMIEDEKWWEMSLLVVVYGGRQLRNTETIESSGLHEASTI